MKLNNKGFSLVELMVVVAIIGILASVAVPSINKYMAKARQSEAKTNLGSLYTAEKAFAAEYTLFHSAFQAVGFAPEGRMRYNVGFGAAGANAGAAQGYTVALASVVTNSLGYCGIVAGNQCVTMVGPNGANPPAVAAASTTAAPAAGATFTAEATAVLIGAQPDTWTIDNVKVLNNTVNGIL